MFCVYEDPENADNAFLVYVESSNPRNIKGIRVSSQIEEIEELKEEDSNIDQLSCGSSHVCWLTKNNDADCFGGSSVGGEGVLTNDMKTEVLAL